MKRTLFLAALLALAFSTTACGTPGLPALSNGAVAKAANAQTNAQTNDVVGAIKEIAKDPNCAHTDRLQGNLGGLSGNNLSVFVERVCPVRPVAPVAVGSEVGK